MKTATFHFSDKDVTIHYEPFGEPDYSVVMTDANEVSRHIFDLTDAGWNIRFTHPQKKHLK